MARKPLTCVWEVTMSCNMRCGHCGSSCENALPGELTTQEAFDVIDQLADLNIGWVTLSGGEPLTRKDIVQIVNRLYERNISTNIISNALLLNEDMVNNLKGRVSTVAISIDGTEDVHDNIRMKGAFKNAKKAFKLLKEAGITTGSITTVTKKNIDILPDIKRELISIGVDSWQLQIGLPMGNLKENSDWVLEPKQINSLLDFCYESSINGEIIVYPADCIGYFTKRELEIRKISFGMQRASNWDGCNAGMRGFGILHNGDILGCTSIRDKKFVEGNVKERRLIDIWNDPECFKWRTQLKKTDLKDDCSICIYGSKCLGGCPNTRLTMNGDLYSENQYCVYNQFIKNIKEDYSTLLDINEIKDLMFEKTAKNEFQLAAFLADRALELEPDNAEVLKCKGFNEYMCGNYELSVNANNKSLESMPDDPHALKGLGLGLLKLGRGNEALKTVEKAAKSTNYKDNDILNDLTYVQSQLQSEKIYN